MIGNIFSWGAAPNKRAADPTSSSASSRASANIRHRYEMPTPAQHRHSHRIDTLGPHRKYEISTSTGSQFDTLLRPTTASVNGGHVHVLLDEMCKQLRSQQTCLNAMAARQESLNKTVKRLNAKVAAYSSTKPKDIGFHEPRDTPCVNFNIKRCKGCSNPHECLLCRANHPVHRCKIAAMQEEELSR